MIHLRISPFEWLSLIAQGHAAFQLLYQATEFGLFERLHREGPLSPEEVSKSLQLAESPTRILLTGLTVLKFLKRMPTGKYQLTEVSRRFLIQSSPENLIDVLGWQRFIVYPGIEDAGTSLRENRNQGLEGLPGDGNTLYEKLSTVPKLQATFQKAMSSLSRANHAELMENLPAGTHRRLVDCGGGDATNVIALCERNPRLNAVVFDQPDVCEIAKLKIEAHGIGNRVTTYPGELFSTPFPADVDAVLMSHLLTIWSPEKNVELLGRAFSALPSKGKIYLFNMAVDNDESGPFSSALGSLYFQCVATGQGRLYRREEFQSFLKMAGFVDIEERALRNAHYFWSATKP